MRILILVVLLCLDSTTEAKQRYDGYQLLGLKLSTTAHRQLIRDLSDNNDLELDFWSEGYDNFDIFVPPQSLKPLATRLTEAGISYTVKSQNVQIDIDVEEFMLREKERGRNGERLPIDYNTFNTYEDIMSELEDLVARCPSGLTCQTVVHGVSYEGRDIKGIRVYNPNTSTRKVWLDATIHAREWLATAVSLKIIKNIFDNYATDSEVAGLVDKYDWYMLPIVNVDGYAFTWTGDRLWRKNRAPNNGAVCLGTDLNRNFNQMWATSGSTSNPCTITYHGDSPASELETQAMQRALDTMGSQLLMSVNMHTYGRMWLSPWSYENPDGSCYVGPDDAEVFRVSNAAADAVEDTHNTVWTRGPFCTVLYPGSGTSVDYGKGVAGLKYTFLPELRGDHFIVPAAEIQPAFEETWNGIKAAIAAIEVADDYYDSA